MGDRFNRTVESSATRIKYNVQCTASCVIRNQKKMYVYLQVKEEECIQY